MIGISESGQGQNHKEKKKIAIWIWLGGRKWSLIILEEPEEAELSLWYCGERSEDNWPLILVISSAKEKNLGKEEWDIWEQFLPHTSSLEHYFLDYLLITLQATMPGPTWQCAKCCPLTWWWTGLWSLPLPGLEKKEGCGAWGRLWWAPRVSPRCWNEWQSWNPTLQIINILCMTQEDGLLPAQAPLHTWKWLCYLNSRYVIKEFTLLRSTLNEYPVMEKTGRAGNPAARAAARICVMTFAGKCEPWSACDGRDVATQPNLKSAPSCFPNNVRSSRNATWHIPYQDTCQAGYTLRPE